MTRKRILFELLGATVASGTGALMSEIVPPWPWPWRVLVFAIVIYFVGQAVHHVISSIMAKRLKETPADE
jgi:hypothetical protein